MEFVNLTRHEFDFCNDDGHVIKNFPSSGSILRLQSKPLKEVKINSFHSNIRFVTFEDFDDVLIDNGNGDIKYLELEKLFAGKIIIVSHDVGKWIRENLNPNACSFVVVAPKGYNPDDYTAPFVEMDEATKRCATGPKSGMLVREFEVYFPRM